MKDAQFYFENEKGSVGFDNGVIGTSTYSYCIDSYGDLEMDQEATKDLYEVMKKYYDNVK